MRVLFVCSGNTCRSPLAEALFRRMLDEAGRQDITVESAGTGAYDGAPASEGSFLVAVEAGLALANDATVIIPGHGPIARRADLVRYRDMLIDVRSRVGQGIARGRTLEQIKADRIADGYGPPDGFISPDSLIETIYRSLRAAPYAQPQ